MTTNRKITWIEEGKKHYAKNKDEETIGCLSFELFGKTSLWAWYQDSEIGLTAYEFEAISKKRRQLSSE